MMKQLESGHAHAWCTLSCPMSMLRCLSMMLGLHGSQCEVAVWNVYTLVRSRCDIVRISTSVPHVPSWSMAVDWMHASTLSCDVLSVWVEGGTYTAMCMHDQRGRGGSGCGQQCCELQGGNVSKWGEQDCGVSVSVYVCMCIYVSVWPPSCPAQVMYPLLSVCEECLS